MLELQCPDCGAPVSSEALCAACDQDREMQRAEVDDSEAAKVIRGDA